MSGPPPPPPPQQHPSDEEIRKQRAEAEAIKQKALAMLLDSEARQRLTNIKMVKPDLASAVENYLINAATTGRLNRALSDNELKQILLSIQQPKREFKINRL
jgi:programmed cell death protein 5